MTTPLVSPPPPPPLDASMSPSTVKRTRKTTQLRSLATRLPDAERPVVNVDPAIGKVDGPHKKKLRTYLGIVARDKAEFQIPEAFDSRTKKRILQIVSERWRQFKSDLTKKWALVADQDGVDDTQGEMSPVLSDTQRPFLGGCEEKGTSHLEAKHCPPCKEAAQSGGTDGVIDPPSPIRRHVKWKMARTKKTGQVMSEAAKEIADKIEVLTAAIGRAEHPGRVRAAGIGITIKKYFGSAPRTSCNSSSLPPKDLQQLTQQIRDQLEKSITEKGTRQLMASLSQMQSQFQSQMQSQGLGLPPEHMVGPSGPHVRNDLETGDSDKCGLYIEANPPRLVALGRVYEGSTLPGQVKVGVEEVKDAQAPVPVPTDEVTLVGQTLNTFLAWLIHLVEPLSEHRNYLTMFDQQATVSLAKPPQRPDPKVDDPLYLMALTIPKLFLKPFQVNWDATMFWVFNPDFSLCIKHEDLSEIHFSETSMREGNSDVYGFLEPQSIQRFGQSQFDSESYIKSWMHSSKCDVYLGAYLNGALKGLDDNPQPKSKAAARWIVVKYFNDARPLGQERLKLLRTWKMAEVVLEGVLGHLSSPVGKELGLFLGFDQDLERLTRLLTSYYQNAEEKQFSNGLVKIWLQNLKDTTHELKDIMNKYVYEELCLEHEEVKCCLSERVQSSGLSSFHPMHMVPERKSGVTEEKRSGVIKWHQTTSLFITEPKVYGREIDNDKIVEFFVNVASHSEDLLVYSIIGLGGLGKTTLAQLIFNYEKVVNHFELRIWVCVSEGFSLKRMEKATIEQYLGVLIHYKEDHKIFSKERDILLFWMTCGIISYKIGRSLNLYWLVGQKGASILLTTPLAKMNLEKLQVSRCMIMHNLFQKRFVALQIGCLDGSAVSDKVNLELDSEGRGTVADVVMEATAGGDMGDLLGADVGCTEGGELAGIKIGVDVVLPLMMMSSPLEISEPIASTHTNDNEVNVQVPADSTQVEANNQENEHQEAVVGRKRKKTSVVWNDFDEMEISHGVKKAVCRYCKSKFATGGIGSSTTHLKRHSNSCIQKKAKTTAESR
ncbi:putative disease resistance protein RGA4 [Glycine soja]